MKGDFNQIIEDLQNVKPWIHIIPNNTTAGDCVSAALAAGADATVSDEEYGQCFNQTINYLKSMGL